MVCFILIQIGTRCPIYSQATDKHFSHVLWNFVTCLSLCELPLCMQFPNLMVDYRHHASYIIVTWSSETPTLGCLHSVEWNSGMDYWNGGMLHRTYLIIQHVLNSELYAVTAVSSTLLCPLHALLAGMVG